MSKQAIRTDSHSTRAPGMERDSSSPFPPRVVFIVSPLPSSVALAEFLDLQGRVSQVELS